MIKKRSCPSCGQSDYKVAFVKDGFKFAHCLNCRLMYLPEVLSENFHFSDDYYDEGELAEPEPMNERSVRGERMSRLIAAMRRAFGTRKDLKILDVGCGKGWHLDFLRHKGYARIRGIEVNDKAARAALARGLDVDLGFLESHNYCAENFDVVYLDQVLEHLEDPKLVLGETLRILKKGGLVWASVPNIDAWHIRLRLGTKHRHFEGHTHLNYFTCGTLKRFFEQSGFRVQRLGTYLEEVTLQRLKGVLFNPGDFDIPAIQKYKKAEMAAPPKKELPKASLKKWVGRLTAPVNFPLVRATRLLRRGAYLEIVARRP